MKQSFTFTHKEIARIITDKLIDEGKLPRSNTGVYGVTWHFNLNREMVLTFEEEK